MNGAHVSVVITGANITHGNSFNFIIIARCTWLVKDTLWEWKERWGTGEDRGGEKKGMKRLAEIEILQNQLLHMVDSAKLL